MTADTAQSWQKDFGVDTRKPPSFFSGKDDLTPEIPQAHALRRAFDVLDLDGILCMENSPLVYFKQMDEITTDKVLQLHRKFWNHSGAPVLVLISKKNVHIYSGMSRPVSTDEIQEGSPNLVKTLNRISEGLCEFLISVESGEFFRQYSRFFDPNQRVDRDLLKNLKDTRDALNGLTIRNTDAQILDALLCRLVFTCYLFDRKVINKDYLQSAEIENVNHLSDILNIKPVGNAKGALYKLFKKLGKDFNGDLFSDDLDAEARKISNKHIEKLNDFFQGTRIRDGQRSFWRYDFSVIPIETISAIYEYFIKESAHQDGAFYTPRFLAEIVLDTALEGYDTFLGKKFLDPACGSGIFLVGLFNRIAEEWKQVNLEASNDQRAVELIKLMQDSLFGVDVNPTACRITAFSLYLAYLDQLEPRDIQRLPTNQKLPFLVVDPMRNDNKSSNGNIWSTDFFENEQEILNNVNLVIGNPPWASSATDKSPAGQWCKANEKVLPDKQIAVAFLWKAAEHVSKDGQICFILPYGTLFKHGPTALAFQKNWIDQYKIDLVLNLSNYSQFLFRHAKYPAIVVKYKAEKPENKQHPIEYWVPKVDWAATQAEIITVSSSDRFIFSTEKILKDLNGPDAPQIWQQCYWATPRDLKFLDRLSLYPRLRNHVRESREIHSDKPWIMAEGFQPVGKSDDPKMAKLLKLPSTNFLKAKNSNIDLFILPDDCIDLEKESILVRNKSNKNQDIFQAPHVLITQGFNRVAFADFDVSFQHAIRGIRGPKSHENLLIFLAAYLRSPLAKYFIFHTSSNWGIYRGKAHVQEVKRIPMPFPDELPNSERYRAIVKEVADIVKNAAKQTQKSFIGRENIVKTATAKIKPLIYEYFNIHPLEEILIEDTMNFIVPSIKPSQGGMIDLPTVNPSTVVQRELYMFLLCDMLDIWAKDSPFTVIGKTIASKELGLGIAVLEKISRSEKGYHTTDIDIEENVLQSLDRIRKIVSHKQSTINLIRGLMVFDQNRLYIVKPIAQRHWTQTAALNDADEIAGTLLMHSYRNRAGAVL